MSFAALGWSWPWEEKPLVAQTFTSGGGAPATAPPATSSSDLQVGGGLVEFTPARRASVASATRSGTRAGRRTPLDATSTEVMTVAGSDGWYDRALQGGAAIVMRRGSPEELQGQPARRFVVTKNPAMVVQLAGARTLAQAGEWVLLEAPDAVHREAIAIALGQKSAPQVQAAAAEAASASLPGIAGAAARLGAPGGIPWMYVGLAAAAGVALLWFSAPGEWRTPS